MELVFLGLLCVSLFGKHVHLQSIFPQHEEQRGNKAGRQGWSINVFESSVAVKQNLERRRIYGLSSQPVPDIRLTRTVSGWLGRSTAPLLVVDMWKLNSIDSQSEWDRWMSGWSDGRAGTEEW